MRATVGVFLLLVTACSGYENYYPVHLPVCWESDCNYPSYWCQYEKPSYLCQRPTYGITKYSFSANQQHVNWDTRISGRTITSKVLRLCIIWSYTCNATYINTCFHIHCDSVPDAPAVITIDNYTIPYDSKHAQVWGDDAQMIEYVCVQRQVQSTEIANEDDFLYDQCVTTAGTRPIVGNLFSATSGDQEPHLRWNGRKRQWE